MSEIRRVTETFAVSPQLSLANIAAAKAQGFQVVINNRPDGEMFGQPASDEMAAACLAAGLTYHALPFSGPPPREVVEQTAALVGAAPGPILAFCRSGTRSITAWALAEALAGRRKADDIIALAANAGYDLSGARGALLSLST